MVSGIWRVLAGVERCPSHTKLPERPFCVGGAAFHNSLCKHIFFNHESDLQTTSFKNCGKTSVPHSGGHCSTTPRHQTSAGASVPQPLFLEYNHPTVFHIPPAPAQKAKEFQGFQPTMFHKGFVEHCLRPVKMPAKLWNAPPPMQKRQRSMEHSPPARVEQCFSLVF